MDSVTYPPRNCFYTCPSDQIRSTTRPPVNRAVKLSNSLALGCVSLGGPLALPRQASPCVAELPEEMYPQHPRSTDSGALYLVLHAARNDSCVLVHSPRPRPPLSGSVLVSVRLGSSVRTLLGYVCSLPALSHPVTNDMMGIPSHIRTDGVS